MSNVLDVMSVQQRSDANKMQKVQLTNYLECNKPGAVSRFLFECAKMLQIKPTTAACAAVIFHRFFKEVQKESYDEYLIAVSSIMLATKIKDDNIQLRDLINVSHNVLSRNPTPLELGELYWTKRDAIGQCELLISRVLCFDLDADLPHKYLLYFTRTLSEWVGIQCAWNSVPITRAAVSFLQDFHHSPKIIKHKPTHVALCCISLALQTYGVQVPLSSEENDASMWYTPLVSDMTKDKHWEIIEDIMEMYNQERELC